MTEKLFLPWRVVQNWRGKVAIVDARNDKGAFRGRVCNLPLDRRPAMDGVTLAQVICDTMNAKGEAK